MALVNSGIAMHHLYAAVSCSVTKDEEIIVHPDESQLKVRYTHVCPDRPIGVNVFVVLFLVLRRLFHVSVRQFRHQTIVDVTHHRRILPFNVHTLYGQMFRSQPGSV